jgi:hypothetical protein
MHTGQACSAAAAPCLPVLERVGPLDAQCLLLTPRPPPQAEAPGAGGEQQQAGKAPASDADSDDDGEGGGGGGGAKLTKKQRKAMQLARISELKQATSRPDVVEVWDVTAPDPHLLVFLKVRCWGGGAGGRGREKGRRTGAGRGFVRRPPKGRPASPVPLPSTPPRPAALIPNPPQAYRNTVPVPRHWSQKRKYLQGKRGIEKPPFKLPEFIEATGGRAHGVFFGREGGACFGGGSLGCWVA